MAKVNFRLLGLAVLTLLCTSVAAQEYAVRYRTSPQDSTSLQKLALPATFASRLDVNSFLATLLPSLQGKGFVTASLDSVRFDSAAATISLFLGQQYQWGTIRTQAKDAALLQAVRFPTLRGTMDFAALQSAQRRILDYLEETGHPFGKTYLDSIGISAEGVSALLRIDEGPLYKIDSIQVFGEAKVNSEFLQKYLDIPAGSLYNRQKIVAAQKKLAELTYVEEEKPMDVSMLATGSTLNLYLKPKRSSQVNALVGFLPNSQQLSGERKFQLTVDANILLRNSFGGGETIGLVWQQLQQSSPRLNFIFEQPYIFKSQVGLAFAFDIYKRDSLFLNVNMNLGASYKLAARQTASLFLQRRQSIVSGINAQAIIQNKQLPQDADVSSLNFGAGYEYNSTDYRFNPRRGSHLAITGSAGTKKLRKSNLILELKDPANPSFKFESLYDTVKMKAYQFRVNLNGAHYLPLGRQTVLKLAANAGIFQSPSIFRNELFQIGGNRLLRGFDEESQFVAQYGVGTVEFRLLTGLNSAFFGFVDGGWGKYPTEAVTQHTYISGGIGLSFQPKAGLINVTWAVGKRDDADFNLRQSKVHIGFVSFF